MSDCCEIKSFEGASPAYKRALLIVIAINGIMFVVEMFAGFASGSQALKADALDFGGDTATYAISLAVIGSSVRLRARASLLKAGSLAAIAAFILVTTAIRFFGGAAPIAETMGLIGFLALIANVASVMILLRWRDGDSNVRSVWLCSRNDAIGNVGVIAAGGMVALTGAAWPDLVVACLLASLFLRSSASIVSQALGELRSADLTDPPVAIPGQPLTDFADHPAPHTPPLGHAALTPFYDLAIAALTRESIWRRRLVQALDPQSDDRILDVGSGTGSLAIHVHNQNPNCSYRGVDPDEDAVRRARAKTEQAGSKAVFDIGYLNDTDQVSGAAPSKIVSSLVLHQVPLAEKQRILNVMFDILKPGGRIHIADYGRQTSWVSRFLFRHTVQSLDGLENTQPNADGVLPELMKKTGFASIEEHDRIATATGTISLYRGAKPENLGQESIR